MNRKDRRATRQKAGSRGGPAYSLAIRSLLDEGTTQHRAGNLAAAAVAYRKILAKNRDNPDALNLLGLTYYQQEDHQPALDLIARASELAPSNSSYQNNLGIVLCELDRDSESIEHFRRAVDLDATNMDARINLGKSLRRTGRTEAAISTLEDTLRHVPDAAEAHAVLALTLADEEDTARAGDHFRRAVEIDPTNALYHFNLGTHFLNADNIPAAVEALRTSVRLNPKFADAQSQLGAALRRHDRPNDAVVALTTALRLEPSHIASWLLLAAAHKDLQQIEKALEAIRKAIQLDPTSAEAYDQLGAILRQGGRDSDALAAYDKAIELEPDHLFAAANRAYVFLPQGRFAEGWRDYRGRTSVLRTRDRLFQDRLPDDLSGRRVLLLRDQGLGDQIFFLRFVPELKRRSAHVTYRGEPKILSILERIPAIDTVIDEEQSETLPDADYRISVGDLPYVLGMTRISDTPPPIPLSVPRERAERLREELATFGPAPYIGVTWRAGMQRFNLLSKVGPLEGIARSLMKIAGTVVILQRNPHPDEMDRFTDCLGRPVCDMTVLNDDLEAMLALLDELDDYVCVSNTNVHLRAGLDRMSRVLVPYPADYRWMKEGDESPWFPGSAVYREDRDTGWRPALESLASDLAAAFR